MKNQRGAITIITLATVLFMISFLISTFVIIMNRRQIQAELKSKTKEIYENEIENIDEIYDGYFADETETVPVLNVEQLFKVGTNNNTDELDKCIIANNKIYRCKPNLNYKLEENLQFEVEDYETDYPNLFSNGEWIGFENIINFTGNFDYNGKTIDAKAIDVTNVTPKNDINGLRSATLLCNAGTNSNIYTWKEISEIAEAISNTAEVLANTAYAVEFEIGGVSTQIIRVGDTLKVAYTEGQTTTYKIARIIGFNHDILTNSSAYGGGKTNQYAGITFEFVDFIGANRAMNSTNSNENGWVATQMRKDLNGYSTNNASQSGVIGGLGTNLGNSSYIKQVKKAYLPDYSSAILSTTPAEDYLWLLSCGEIWSTGYNGGVTRGIAKNSEGTQYKWYNLNETGGDSSYSTANNNLKKPSSVVGTSNPGQYWWLRSSHYDTYMWFCNVYTSGRCFYSKASASYGVAPGFSI